MRETRPPPARSAGSSGQGRGVRVALGVLSSLLVLSSLVLPLWRAHLIAPQYPGGLDLYAFGSWVEGDVTEISSLNHYVGMRALDPADLPEMALWPFAVGLALAAVVVATVAGRGTTMRKLAISYLWLLPVGVLAVIQVRLYQYGHDLDPGAALRIGEFTPWAIGPTRIWNFTTWSYPGSGLASLVVAAGALTWGRRLAARFLPQLGAVSLLALLLSLGMTVPSASAHEVPGHTDHGDSSSGAAGTLSEILAQTPAGGTILLEPGIYRGNVVIDKPITLLDLGGSVIEGDGQGSVLTIRAAGTVIAGVEVRGSGQGPVGEPAAIRVEADDVRVEGVEISDSYIGIAVVGASNTRLERNLITGRAAAVITGAGHAVDATHDDHGDQSKGPARGDGIWLWDAEHVLVQGNHIHNSRDGIYLSHGSMAIIDSNHIQHSRYAVHSMFARDLVLVENHFEDNLSGAVLMYGGPVLVLRNTITDHRSPSTGFGVLLKDVESAELVENVIVGNHVGVHFDGPTAAEEESQARANTIATNTVGIALYPSARAVISGNSLLENRVQVLTRGGDAGHVSWSEKGWGNYWSTYRWGAERLPGRGVLPHAEGGAIEASIARSPVLSAVATSPGLRLLGALEQRLGIAAPVAVDDFPLTSPLSPPLQTPATDPVAIWPVGLLLLGAGGAGLSLLRVPGRSRGSRQLPATTELVEGRTRATG